MKLGATYLGNNRCAFTVWAPLLDQVAIHTVAPQDRLIPLECNGLGYWQGVAADIPPGTLYYCQYNGQEDRPDPASHSQPQGIHQCSAVVNHQQFGWQDQAWSGMPLSQLVIYELHVGTFTPVGTFAAIIERLPILKDLGITAIELLPVAQFPGERNWGYDGAAPFAVQHSYGGPTGLKQLVNACHQQGIAVILDVVYNHLGPEGNYLWGLGTYFTDRYKTPWGSAVNFDGAYSDGVRHYFVENVLYWLETYHIDALRLDAIHAIYDCGAKHILLAMSEAVAALNQTTYQRYLIAESDLNDVRIIRPAALGGYGLDAQWSDDLHHALHALLTGEQSGYYGDFGQMRHLAAAYQKGFVYDWLYSQHRQRFHGSDARDRPGQQFVVCIQNHDQVGNRMQGDRLGHLVSFEAQKLAAAVVILSPYLPMLFMGEEYGETAPFQYFVSHGDPDLIEAVRRGRREEFAAFHSLGEAPDPQSETTFQRSKLNWDLWKNGQHQQLWRFYQRLLQLRSQTPALANLSRTALTVATQEGDRLMQVHRWFEESQVLCLFNMNAGPVVVRPLIAVKGIWQKQLDSADPQWGGLGTSLPDLLTDLAPTMAPESVAIYHLVREP